MKATLLTLLAISAAAMAAPVAQHAVELSNKDNVEARQIMCGFGDDPAYCKGKRKIEAEVKVRQITCGVSECRSCQLY